MIPSTAAIAFLATVGLGLFVTEAVRRVALRRGLVDRPDGHRKLHVREIPLGGGVAVFLTALAAALGLLVADRSWRELILQEWTGLAGLMVAGGIIVMVGVVDDSRGLRGRQKLVGQILAALVLVLFGLSIHSVQLFGWKLELGLLAIPFTLFWLLGAMNSINLLDGIDGLATTLGVILCGTIAALAVITAHPAVAMIALIFTAALTAFLRFNCPPAKMFLGDAGSMLIGLVVGALSIQASLKGAGTVLLAAPLAVLVIPILDSAAAILRRKLTGRSVYATDRGHLHHRLLQVLGNHKTLLLIAVCCLLMSAAALLSVYLRNDLIAVVSGIALVSVFVVTRLFGHSELLLLTVRLRGFSRSLLTRPGARAPHAWEDSVRLQGDRHWEMLWTALTEWADKLSLQQIRLDVNAPVLHESFHASWRRSAQEPADRSWKFELPLVCAENPVGHLKITGHRGVTTAGEVLEQLQHLMQPFEEHLNQLVEMRSEPVAAAEVASAVSGEEAGEVVSTVSP